MASTSERRDERILQVVHQQPGITKSKLVADLGGRRKEVLAGVDELIADGHLIRLADELRVLSVDLVTAEDGVDTTTPHGELYFHILGAVAEFERDSIAGTST